MHTKKISNNITFKKTKYLKNCIFENQKPPYKCILNNCCPNTLTQFPPNNYLWWSHFLVKL